MARWFTVEEVADYLGVSKDYVYRATGHGLPAYRIGPKILRFDREEVDAWVRREPISAPSAEESESDKA